MHNFEARTSRPTTTSFVHPFIAVIFVSLLSAAALAQGSSLTDGHTPSGVAPGAPAGSYALSGFDNINIFNGHLNVHLPLMAIGGRGKAGYTMTLPIERKWRVERAGAPESPIWYATANWWTIFKPGYSPGVFNVRAENAFQVDCVSQIGTNMEWYSNSLTRLTFTTADGTEYEFRDALNNGNVLVNDRCGVHSSNRGRVWITKDGTSATFITDYDLYDSQAASVDYPVNPNPGTPFGPELLSGYLIMRDGTRYRIDKAHVSWIRDTNGNTINFTYSNNGYGEVTEIKDSLNRRVTISYGNPDVITFKGFGGADRTIKVWRNNLSDQNPATRILRNDLTFPIKTNQELFPSLFGSSTPADALLVSAVELPDGRRYKFKYNYYAELARIELPTGGAFEYDWGPGPGANAEGVIFNLAPGWELPPERRNIYRRVTERRVYVDAGSQDSLESRMIFTPSHPSYSDPSPWITVVKIVKKDAQGNLLSASRHYFYGSPTGSMITFPFDYARWDDGREYQTEILAGESDSSSVLRRTTNVWQNPPGAPGMAANNPRIVETIATLLDITPNLVSKQTFDYDQYNNVTDVWEHDFGVGAPGPLLRHTHTDYLTTNPFQGNVNYATDANIHIRNLPIYKSVSDGNGVEIAKTWFDYDAYGINGLPALQDCPGIVQHDGGFHTGYGARGNLLKITRLATSDPTGYVVQHFFYDIAGNVVRKTDGFGAPTDFDFSDRFGAPNNEARSNSGAPELAGGSSYAFPTKVTNALGHTTYTKYDYYLGKPVNTEDANGVVSSVEYNDALDRPTRGVRAIGTSVASQTVFVYNDSSSPVNDYPARSITTISDKDVLGESNGGNGLKSVTLYDGLGRTWRSAAYEGNSSWTITDTQFDALGRVSRVSNPYRAADPGSASAPGDLWTTTTYDALGRVVKVTTPDGAHVDTDYNGNQVTVTDQAGKKRRSETDALGRLVKVTEDPGGLNYETTYFYDPLDNLRAVNQGGQGRWFSYDSLSRLIRARNPEQNCSSDLPPHTDPYTGAHCWAMSYKYDANSNLTERIDARGVVTKYHYDALNRNWRTEYINGSQTNTVTRSYDGAVNGKGRLTSAWTTEMGVNVTRYVIDSYDALGRPLVKHQQFWQGGDWGPSYSIQQNYNLAGNVKSLRYPSGNTVEYAHDQMNRTNLFFGNLGGQQRSYSSVIRYNPAGMLIKEKFGTQTPLYHNLHYNNRLQLVDIRLGDNETDEWSRNRGSISFFYGATAALNMDLFANDADNNGNLRRQVNWVPLAGGGDVIPQLDDYAYDALNRIATVSDRQRDASGQWAEVASQSYAYDRWGNRTLNLSGDSGVSTEVVWMDDALPAGATTGTHGGDGWNWVSSSPAPQSGSVSHISNDANWSNWSPAQYSGNVSHQSNISSGFHQHYYYSSPNPVPVRQGGTLYAYIYIDPENIPQEVMLQWGTNTDGWEHRAYWGANIIGFGADGTASRRYMGPLPAAGGWVRLEVPASAVGLEGLTVNAMAFSLYGGRANWDRAGVEGVNYVATLECWWDCSFGECFERCETVWNEVYENYVLVDDSIPAGAVVGSDGGDGWNWRGANHVEQLHQHYFENATETLQVNAGDKLYAWVYLDPASIPSEVMLQWNENGSWEHRAYWGANKIGWGTDGTASRKYMGPLPSAGGWVKLEIPASAVGLEGKILNGMAFTLYGGRAAWDKAGKISPPPPPVGGPPINANVYAVDTGTNRLTSVNGVTISYDAAGNQINDGSGQRVYDAENRLVEAYNSFGALVGRYVYDADGKRVKRITGGQETWYIYGVGGELLAEYGAGASPNSPRKEYGYRNGQLLVVWDASETGDRQLQWVAQDHLGSTRMVVDRSGSLGGVRRHDYAPFGEELFAGPGIRSASNGYSGDSVRQKFGSKERDIETGLDFMEARYYGSVQGRFTSVDPFNPILGKQGASDLEAAERELRSYLRQPQHWNRYVYALNNPLKYVDPDGMQTITVNLNIIYDANSQYTDEEKKRIRDTYIAQAQKNFGKIDVKFNVTETVGFARDLGRTKGNQVQTVVAGMNNDAINAFFTKDSVGPSSEATNYAKSTIFITTNSYFGADPRDLSHGIIHAAGIAGGVNGYLGPKTFLGSILLGYATDFRRNSAENATEAIQQYLEGRREPFCGYGCAKANSPPTPTTTHTANDMQVLKAGLQRFK